MTMVARQDPSPFDAIRGEDGRWSARQLQSLMGYTRWENLAPALTRAMASARNEGVDVEEVFLRSQENSTARGGRPREDFRLTRHAAYLVAMNGDPNKKEVAAAQAYFAAMTYQAELATTRPAPREITAAAGPVPYKEQAEILSILRPVLPEAYATATGKVIMARVMGERPELEPSETPLYASTFLAEKGHKPKTVAKFQSGFGSRVSNRYFKVHGRRPGKIPGPAGSRIDSVAFYTEDDRPILEQVYAEIADLIDDFEGGGQMRMTA